MARLAPTLGSSRAFQRALISQGLPCVPGNFCHYTSLAGFGGILTSSEIWLSDHRFLNDPTEHAYGKELAVEILNKSTKQEENPAFASLLDAVKEDILQATPVFYIASFSLAKDRLDLWRAYGFSNDSVCLVFEDEAMRGRAAALGAAPIVEKTAVVYNRAEQTHLLQQIVSIFRQEFLSQNCEVSSAFSLWEADLTFLIARQLIRFKNEEFSSEEEVRFVMSTKPQEQSYRSVQHRLQNGIFVPYVGSKDEALPRDVKLPLTEVIVGPNANRALLAQSIKAYLQNTGYSHVSVRESTVPYRK